MSGFIIITFVLSLFCIGHSLTITGTKDAEYDGIDNYYEPADIESSGTKCYFKAALKGCKKGKILNTIFADAKESEKPFTTTVTSTSAACLEATCTRSSRNLILSRSIEIGGDGENSKPDTLNKGHSNGLYNNRAECMRSGTAVVNIKCKPAATDIDSNTGKKKMEIEEYDPEIPDGAMEDAEMMMEAEIQDNVVPGHPAKVWEDDDNNGDDKDGDDDNDNNEKEDKIAAEFEEKFAKAEEQSEVMTEDAVMAENDGKTAKIQFNNWFRGCLNVRCGNRYGLYHVMSGFSSHYLDRIWRFYCKQASDHNFNHCYWTGYKNWFDWPLLAQCGQNYVLNGLYAYYSSGHRDRRFSLLCCRAPYHTTRTCSLSGHINGWRGWMNYGVGGHQRVFTGLFSYHHNGYEDRVWKVEDCYYSR